MVIDGADLGAVMTPSDVLIELRLITELQDDEIIDAMAAGADRVERDMTEDPQSGMPALAALAPEERLAVIEVARSVTRSRIDAWRRRHRQMTWPELRVLLLGLRGKLTGS
jgi:hypothetical protein